MRQKQFSRAFKKAHRNIPVKIAETSCNQKHSMFKPVKSKGTGNRAQMRRSARMARREQSRGGE